MGRPLKEVDEDVVRKLAGIGCTYQEIADFVEVDRSTIIRRFAPVIKKGKSKIIQGLRMKQIQIAMDGNVTMLIWLGKNMLHQKDQPSTDDEPVKNITLRKKKSEESKDKDNEDT